MEHAEALERIEIAAVEPEGLDRLMAGDTPDAAPSPAILPAVRRALWSSSASGASASRSARRWPTCRRPN